MNDPSPAPPDTKGPLLSYLPPAPKTPPLSGQDAKPLIWLFTIDILLAGLFVLFSYCHELAIASMWMHHDNPRLPILLASIAVMEAIPLSLCIVRVRGAGLAGLIFSLVHFAACVTLAAWLWLLLMFSDFSEMTTYWACLYTVAAQGFCNLFLVGRLFPEVTRPRRLR